jgi:hypothetical protein
MRIDARSRSLASGLQVRGVMGEGFRDRIWRFLDDPQFERHEGLRNALYRLLVASEIPRGQLPADLDGKVYLDAAAAAVEGNNAAVIAGACEALDDLVVRLATLATRQDSAA